ncbi:hypothetical protein Esi_0030_0073 [Ectocarpus siliculosus]|uniref:Uncharacterized protein n=1 Tax=Ectocarpus siliculosus TaxID=2880 RepID=D8LKH5_ECTSI|nr:hypothetical protein Esi_0030_0073 [Ectocarpus siliculosus]|eukprot:CBN74565.1 hypothetical protein Esi_0030_0073 [Ectocarpus siliculosus]
MLRQVVKVLTDPTSAGLGGRPDEPLLLVQKLALDETDAIFGAFEPRFLGYAADAGSWSPLPGGFSRWLARYHRVALHGSRPVLATVHGDDVCALEKELYLGVRVPSEAGGVTPNDIIDSIAEEPPASASAGFRRQATNERGKVSIPADRVRETRSGLPHTAYIDAARRQPEVLIETCPIDRAGSQLRLAVFQGNTLDRDPRTKIWKQMT